MENNSVVTALEVAEQSFERAPETIEEGLNVEDAELVQLRRACRLLAAASYLLKEGYYTVVIESSFVAIERTIQFRLIHDGAMSGSEVITRCSPRNSPSCGTRTERKRTIGSVLRPKGKPRRCRISHGRCICI
jgi:hypothetical protein